MRKNSNNVREYRRRVPVLSITREALSFDEFDREEERRWRQEWGW